jgi:predicted XRE-type DNA-binding protein
VIVLHAFEKKTQRTSKRDIELAKGRLSELMKDRRRPKPRSMQACGMHSPIHQSRPRICEHAPSSCKQIAAIAKKNRWTQTEAARHCGITQPRMHDLLRVRVSRFSLDALANIATSIGRRVHVELETA